MEVERVESRRVIPCQSDPGTTSLYRGGPLWHTDGMRRLPILTLLCLLACDDEPAPAPPPSPPEEPEPERTPDVEIPVDDDNRFVKTDLEAFLEAYPDVVRASDEEAMRICTGDACLESVPDGVDPFDGEGVRYLVPLWYRACLSESGAGCQAIAQAYNGSAVVDRPVFEDMTREVLDEKTRQYAVRACELSDDHCRMWASMTLSESEDPSQEDVARAIERLRAECDADIAHGCAILGRAADDHPEEIGTAREWYEKACTHGGEPKESRYCDEYTRILFETGRRADREEAIRILTPICDVTSDQYADMCEGSAEDGTLQCDRFRLRFGKSCRAYAETQPPERALPILTAICDDLATEEGDENAATCRRAIRLARQTGQDDAYVQNLLTRVCDAIEMRCLLDNDMESAPCDPVRARCMEEGP